MRHFKVLLSALALVLAAAACGSDDSTDDTAPLDTDNGVEETEDIGNGDDNGETGNGDDDANGDDNGEQAAPSGDYAEFCERADELEQQPAQDPETEAAQFEEMIQLAPDPIADDLRTLADYADRFEEMEDSDDPAAINEAFEMLMDPEFMGALESIDQFLVDECGFEPTDFGMEGFDDMDAEMDF